MFTLIALGTGAAWLYSVAAVLAPGLFPESLTMHGVVEVYFESAAVIVTLVLFGQVLELQCAKKTGSALRELLSLAPPTARVIRDGRDEEVPLDKVRVGDQLRVRPGEKVPVDGAIVEGRSDMNESLMTGESMPVVKSAGDAVIGGTINGTGSFVMRAERVGSETVLARIVGMVADAQRSRGSDSAGRGRGGGVLRAGGGAGVNRHVHCVAGVGAPAAAGVCGRECRGGADHRMSRAPGAGDANGHYGRRSGGGREGVLIRSASGAGDAGKSGHRHRQQDGNADRRASATDGNHHNRCGAGSRTAVAGGGSGAAQRASAGAGRFGGGEQAWADAAGRNRVCVNDRRGSRGKCERSAGVDREAGVSGGQWNL